jgi:hypothetical protein
MPGYIDSIATRIYRLDFATYKDVSSNDMNIIGNINIETI